ncbi:LysR substrate-binding domain-containing protein [Streptomyces sp. Mo3]
MYLLIPSGHRLSKRKHIRISDLAQEGWICSHENAEAERFVFHMCAEADFRPEVLFRTDDYNLPFELVRRGLGSPYCPN